MELIERYLQAVKFWLPKQQKHDMIAEISEDIHSQMEEREIELGRKLNEAEVEAMLKQRGRPMLVANRYLPREHLIGPVLFPIYRFVLKTVMLCYLLPWVLVWIGLMVFDPVYRAGHTGHSWLATLLSMWSSLWFTAFVAIGVVTIVFAVLERVQAKSGFIENWSPRKLPPIRNPNLIRRSASSIEFAVNLIVFVWWAANMSSPVVLNHPNLRISLSPLWPYFFWGFLLLALVNTALAGVNLMRPYWSGLRAALRLLTDCVGAALFCWLLAANVLAGIAAVNLSSERALEITNLINYWMARMLPFAIAVGIAIAATDIYRLIRLKTAKYDFPGNAARMHA